MTQNVSFFVAASLRGPRGMAVIKSASTSVHSYEKVFRRMKQTRRIAHDGLRGLVKL